MWRDREIHMKEHLNNAFFEKIFSNRRYMQKLRKTSHNQYVNMVKGMIGYIPDLMINNEIRQTDLAIALYMMAFDMKMVFPVASKVKNWGYDGSGINCDEIQFDSNKITNHRNFDFTQQVIDTNYGFGDIGVCINVSDIEMNHILDKFFCISSKELLRADVAYLLSHIIGLENTRKLVKITDKGRMK
jgi:hypothetical protein